jgi:hypothetical protein
MASLESINRLLAVATALLDHAATEMRDIKLEPVSENIEHIARALNEAFEVRLKIFALRPDLGPSSLGEPSKTPGADRALMECLFRVYEFERQGNLSDAVADLKAFAASETLPLYRDIALGEIERLKNEPSS